jgi:hypothetical protein
MPLYFGQKNVFLTPKSLFKAFLSIYEAFLKKTRWQL